MKKYLSRLTVSVPFALGLIVAACSDGTGTGISGPVQADVVIPQGAQLLGFQAYTPDTITVQLNGASAVKVRWRNDDIVGATTVQHTVTDTTSANAFPSTTIPAGDTASVTFTAAGSYPYKCSFHPGMRGLVIVQP